MLPGEFPVEQNSLHLNPFIFFFAAMQNNQVDVVNFDTEAGVSF